MKSKDEVIRLLENAAFFRDEDGKMYRIEHAVTEENHLAIMDEDDGETYDLRLDCIEDGCKFYAITEIE